MSRLKTIVVMPAYNAARTLEQTIADIPLEYVDELILVDDASADETVSLAHTLRQDHPRLTNSPDETGKIPFHVVHFDQNRGYGGNQKECYRLALERGADIVVMLHPDYQYDPKLVKYFVEFIRDGYFDVMLGSRIRSRKEALAGGMPVYKYLANRFLSLVMNLATGRVLSEWHTGMRAYSREVLEQIPYERFSNDFIFDVQVLFAIVKNDHTIGDIPVPCRYFEEASSINFKRSLQYGLLTLWETFKYLLHQYAQFLTYIVMGFIGFGTNILTFALLLSFGWWYILAGVTAFSCGAVTSFTLQKYATFRERSHTNMARQLTLYLIVILFNLAVSTGLLYVFVDWFDMQKIWAQVLVTGIAALWSFGIFKYVVFTKPAH